MDVSDPIVWSSSSLSTWLRCGLQYRFAHIERIKSPPSIRTVLGSAAHEAVEHNYRQKITTETDEPLDTVLDVYSDSFDTRLPEVEKPDEPVRPAKDAGVGLVRLHHATVAPKHMPVYVEQQVQFEINGRPYQTFIDLVDKDAGGHTVIDLKTSQRTVSRVGHVLQLIAGAAGFRQKTGLTEKDTALHVLIRTKKPQYQEVSFGGPVNNQAMALLSRQIEDADAMVKAGRFPANGLASFACGWCGYTKICPAYRAAYGKQLPQDMDIPPSEVI
jgi:hypothetical protein